MEDDKMVDVETRMERMRMMKEEREEDRGRSKNAASMRRKGRMKEDGGEGYIIIEDGMMDNVGTTARRRE